MLWLYIIFATLAVILLALTICFLFWPDKACKALVTLIICLLAPIWVPSLLFYFLNSNILNNDKYCNFVGRAQHHYYTLSDKLSDNPGFYTYTLLLPLTASYTIVRFLIKSIWALLNYYIFLPLIYKIKGQWPIYPSFSLYYRYSFDPKNERPANTTILTFDTEAQRNIILEENRGNLTYNLISDIKDKKWIFAYLLTAKYSKLQSCVYLDDAFCLKIIDMPEPRISINNGHVNNGIFCYKRVELLYHQIPIVSLFECKGIKQDIKIRTKLNQIYHIDKLQEEVIPGKRLYKKFFTREIANELDIDVNAINVFNYNFNNQLLNN